MDNCTSVTEFFLLGFSNSRELQLVYATMFLLVYLASLMGNLLIITVITHDRHLHTPMYFFLKNLSFIDLCYISVTVPKSILNGLTGSGSISLLGCVLQVFWVTFLACAELLLLTAMSYDRYIAICCPLRYDSIMNRGASVKMVAVSWLGGSFNGFLHTAASCTLPFCGSNVIHQFFCEIPQLLKLSSSRRNVPELAVTVVSAVLVLFSFIAIIISYVRIFSAVMKISSVEGQSKAFSTCLPHLLVFTTFLITCVFEYLKPTSDSPSILDVLLSVFYTVVPPTLNPLIYSLRNMDMKAAIGKFMGSCRIR